MWLEESAWVWLPLLCASAAWIVSHMIRFGRDVSLLRERIVGGQRLELGVLEETLARVIFRQKLNLWFGVYPSS